MASTRMQLLSFDEWPADTDTSAAFFAFGSQVADSTLNATQKIVEQTDASKTVIVVPLGHPGEILWKGVPASVATIVARVRPECLVLVRPQLCVDWGHSRSVWDAIGSQPESSLFVAEPLESEWDEVHLPQLAPRSRPLAKTLAAQIDQLGDASPAGVALRAGLTQMLDDLDQSHHFAQSIEGLGRLQLGDYWHAIMHRREPDYFNAKYWFRRVGTHPVGTELQKPAARILAQCADVSSESWQKKLTVGGWNSMTFVDLCESCAGDEASPLGGAARQIQWMEMLLLLRFCWQNRNEK